MNAAIGGVVGAIEISCTFPTEYTKTVMQLDPAMNKKGFMGVVRETWSNKGFFGFYKGYSALLMFSVPKNSVRFGTYDWASKNLFVEKTKLNNFCCGLTAGAAEALTVVTPQETLKTKLIHDKISATPKYRNLFHGIYTIGSQQGPAGMYRGVLATLLKQSSNQGVRFVVFEDAKTHLGKFLQTKVLVDLLAGAFAGFCSVMANNPVDVVKTKMQGVDAAQYKGFADCFAQVLKAEGPMGFYSGVTPRLARVILDVALTFSLFHSMKRTITAMVTKTS